jgi:UDP-glucose 4-epimerase
MLKNSFRKALVTGGAGFIGSHIIEELLKQEIEVVSIDNYLAGKAENLEPLKKLGKLHVVDCDITDMSSLAPHFEGVDIVFHNAASKKTVCLNDPRRDLSINAEGAFNILELSLKHRIKKVVHASTGSVYGEARYFPQNEEHPVNPTSYYGVSKLAGEKYALAFSHLYGLDVSILRYFHVYGPRQDYSDAGGVVSIFGRKIINGESPVIFGDGSQQRSFTFVKDIVRANFLVAVHPDTKGQAYNCASGIKVTIRELADKVKQYFSVEDLSILHEDWTPGDIKVFDVDNQKLKSLGFEFSTPFDEGLATTLNWLQNYFESAALSSKLTE